MVLDVVMSLTCWIPKLLDWGAVPVFIKARIIMVAVKERSGDDNSA